MVNGLWGRKIGMTQVFSDKNKVVPVTAIDLSNWFVTALKNKERDGYDAVQLGQIRNRYRDQEFSADWLNNRTKYFTVFKEVRVLENNAQISIGQTGDAVFALNQGDSVDVFGITIGHGFQGGVKRHGFTGGPASHGGKLGRAPGSLGYMRSQGRVIKGKRMPGHMGVDRRVMKNLEVVRIETDAKVVLIKGSVPGKSGSLVFVKKRG